MQHDTVVRGSLLYPLYIHRDQPCRDPVSGSEDIARIPTTAAYPVHLGIPEGFEDVLSPLLTESA
jgi:hypothetical protein